MNLKMAHKCHQYSSSFFLVLVVVTLMMISKVTSSSNYLANYCPNTTIFANHSQFETNLNTLFGFLSSNASDVGFYNAVSGSGNTTNDTVYGLFLCRGDQNSSSCLACVTTATTRDLPTTFCPNRKEAVIWYDECMVRYSNKPILATLDMSPTLVFHGSTNVTGNATRFRELLSNMMNDVIIVRAAEGGPEKKFATDFVNYTSSQMIYGLGQCTPDLNSSDCNTCLKSAITRFQGTQGGRVLQPSCIVRYDIHPFFDNSTVLPPSQPSSTHSKKKTVSPKVIVPVVAIGAALLAVTICRTKDKILKKLRGAPKETASEDFTTADSLQYKLETLQSATSNFSEECKLGEGGFGGVYKGTLENGQQIAVKRLSMLSNHGVEQFKNEVLLVAKLQHRNLVRLVGFCFAGQEKLLVYEYVPNKSLDNFIFDPKKQRLLDWGTRYKIIGGIGRGMLYLHHDSRLRIIHRDLKASNILLDEEMNPKIADFGTARIFGIDQKQGNTSRVIGTYGYMSPEYAMHGEFSTSSDVYSFGVLILEIISGKRIRTTYKSGETADDLMSYAWKQWKNGTPLQFADLSIIDSCSSDEVMRCIHLGLLCVQECVDDRPTMATLVLALDSHVVNLPEPEQPSTTMKSRMESCFEDFVSSQSISNSTMSVNDVSITVMEPR